MMWSSYNRSLVHMLLSSAKQSNNIFVSYSSRIHAVSSQRPVRPARQDVQQVDILPFLFLDLLS